MSEWLHSSFTWVFGGKRNPSILFVLICLPCREFFGQGWMKNDKNEKTPYIMRTTKHFNDVCCFEQDGRSAILQTIHPSVLISLPDKQPYCHRDPALRGRGHSSSGHREMGGRGRHLPVSPQLQCHPGDHLLPQSQLCVPPQEDLAQGVQAGAQHDKWPLRIVIPQVLSVNCYSK